MDSRLGKYIALIKQYGVSRCLFRIRYDLGKKYGLLKRRFPSQRWEDVSLRECLKNDVELSSEEYRASLDKRNVAFFFPFGQPPAPHQEWLIDAMEEVDALARGEFRYFSKQRGHLGFPNTDWFLNPFNGQRVRSDVHWCDVGVFDSRQGEIKYIWEPSRFSWAYTLVRAYSGGREDCAEIFWTLLESWMKANPPQMGPNWMCGQEVSLRAMACVFALAGFWRSPATTSERVASLVSLLAVSAERIERNIGYALAQLSNHGVGEAAGLWTIGVLFPELAGSERWRRIGRRVLEEDAKRHNYVDGSYVQHSMNYQRFTLHAFLWCLRLGDLNGVPFSRETRSRLVESGRFLCQMQDEVSGRVPNYGPNDGALILPLNSCDYLDYRPAIGAMHYLDNGKRLYGAGPWSEDLLWFFGEESLQSPVEPAERRSGEFDYGGYFTLRGKESWAMVRCHTYINRPNQADMLHLDLWWRGMNLLRDSGSYSYYDPEGQWHRYFPSTPAHNTVTVDGQDQMIKGAGFRWHSLVKSRFLGRQANDEVELWQGEHYGYERLACRVTHRRTICRVADSCWLVVDDVLGEGESTAAITWHLPDFQYKLDGRSVGVVTPQGSCNIDVFFSSRDADLGVLRGVDNGNDRAGWESRYFGVREEALTIRGRSHGELPMRFITLVSLDEPAKVLDAGDNMLFRWETGDDSRVCSLKLPPLQTDVVAPVVFRRDDQKCELEY